MPMLATDSSTTTAKPRNVFVEKDMFDSQPVPAIAGELSSVASGEDVAVPCIPDRLLRAIRDLPACCHTGVIWITTTGRTTREWITARKCGLHRRHRVPPRLSGSARIIEKCQELGEERMSVATISGACLLVEQIAVASA